MTLQELKQDILKDGIIDKEEVKKLEETFYADGKIDKEEADIAFELNDATSGKDNDPSWGTLFVKTISDFVLNDDDTPGVIDEEESTYLITNIDGDGQVDANEKALCVNLKDKAVSMPQSLTDKMIAWGI